MTNEQIIAALVGLHRQRRYWMKLQSKIDRALESYIRINCTDWNPDATEREREKANKEALALLKELRAGKGELALVKHVADTDASRKPADEQRAAIEKEMGRLAKILPVFTWLLTVRGAAELGLATIMAEAAHPLTDYPTPSHLWSRLGFAPYDGLAGSTWKRESWRPRSLTKDEWIEHPFNGQRYALMHQIGLWLVNAQVEGKEKSGTKHGKPKGPYGEIYVRRRERTDETHPEWTPMHARMDAIRVTMKAFLRNLWIEWQKCSDPQWVDKPFAGIRMMQDAAE